MIHSKTCSNDSFDLHHEVKQNIITKTFFAKKKLPDETRADVFEMHQLQLNYVTKNVLRREVKMDV